MLFVHDDLSFVQNDMPFEDNEQTNKPIRRIRRSIQCRGDHCEHAKRQRYWRLHRVPENVLFGHSLLISRTLNRMTKINVNSYTQLHVIFKPPSGRLYSICARK